MKRFKFITLVSFSVLFSVLISCRKADLEESVQSAQDNASVETEFGNVYDVASGYA